MFVRDVPRNAEQAFHSVDHPVRVPTPWIAEHPFVEAPYPVVPHGAGPAHGSAPHAGAGPSPWSGMFDHAGAAPRPHAPSAGQAAGAVQHAAGSIFGHHRR